MKDQQIYQNMPKNYLHCYNVACELGETCLHRIVARQGISTDSIVKAVNPKYNQGTDCRYYKSDTPVRMAYGMLHAYDKVQTADIRSLRRDISKHFSNSKYYQLRNGEIPITPAEQDFINQTFRECGYPDGASFDRYEDELAW